VDPNLAPTAELPAWLVGPVSSRTNIFDVVGTQRRVVGDHLSKCAGQALVPSGSFLVPSGRWRVATRRSTSWCTTEKEAVTTPRSNRYSCRRIGGGVVGRMAWCTTRRDTPFSMSTWGPIPATGPPPPRAPRLFSNTGELTRESRW